MSQQNQLDRQAIFCANSSMGEQVAPLSKATRFLVAGSQTR